MGLTALGRDLRDSARHGPTQGRDPPEGHVCSQPGPAHGPGAIGGMDTLRAWTLPQPRHTLRLEWHRVDSVIAQARSEPAHQPILTVPTQSPGPHTACGHS